jgi:hypothetical protein
MSTGLNIQLSPEVFTALQQAAVVAGRTPSQEAAAMIERQLHPGGSSNEAAEGRAGRIEDFFGKISFGGPMTNEEIDAELAREYGRGLDGN